MIMDIGWQQKDGVWVAQPEGRLDITQSENLEMALREQIEAEPRSLVINLGSVSYMSSSGIGALLSVYRLITERKLRMALCEVSPPVMKLLDVVEIGQIFQIFPREADAVRSLAG